MKYMILKDGGYAEGRFVPEGAIVIPHRRPTSAHSWDGTQWVFNGFTQEQADSKLRFKRNMLLAQTDWWVLPDRTATQAQLAYRQALRDLPQTQTPTLDENGNLINVNWPQPPTE